jgi:hypothetical protein
MVTLVVKHVMKMKTIIVIMNMNVVTNANVDLNEMYFVISTVKIFSQLKHF